MFAVRAIAPPQRAPRLPHMARAILMALASGRCGDEAIWTMQCANRQG